MRDLETERLILRPPELSDAAAVARHMADGSIARNTAFIPHPYGEEDARAWIGSLAGDPESAVWLIAERDGATVIGCIGFNDMPSGVREVGYWIGPDHRNRGHAREALAAVLDFAAERWPGEPLEAAYFADNPASGRVQEACGFVTVGHGRRSSIGRGGEVDAVITRLATPELPRP